MTKARSSKPLVVVAPMPENLANGRMHWRTKNRKRQAYYTVLTASRLWKHTPYRMPAPPKVPFERVRLTSRMTLYNPMDDDNAVARHKWLIDWLKEHGYIADDRKRNIVWTGMPEQIIKRSEPSRIELTLEPIEDE